MLLFRCAVHFFAYETNQIAASRGWNKGSDATYISLYSLDYEGFLPKHTYGFSDVS